MNPIDEFRSLQTRLSKARETRAAAEALEEEKTREREKIARELVEAGVDVDHLETERERLDGEIAEILAAARGKVEAFEKSLSGSGTPAADSEIEIS